MTVADDVREHLADRSGPLVSIALALAKRLDDAEEKAPAAVAKELRATLAELAGEAAEEEQAVDPLADARAKRASRRAGRAAGAATS